MSDVYKLARVIRSTVTGVCNMLALKLIVFFLLGVFFSYYLGFSCVVTTFLVFVAYAATGGWRFCKVVIKTLPRDLRYADQCYMYSDNVDFTGRCLKS